MCDSGKVGFGYVCAVSCRTDAALRLLLRGRTDLPAQPRCVPPGVGGAGVKRHIFEERERVLEEYPAVPGLELWHLCLESHHDGSLGRRDRNSLSRC